MYAAEQVYIALKVTRYSNVRAIGTLLEKGGPRALAQRPWAISRKLPEHIYSTFYFFNPLLRFGLHRNHMVQGSGHQHDPITELSFWAIGGASFEFTHAYFWTSQSFLRLLSLKPGYRRSRYSVGSEACVRSEEGGVFNQIYTGMSHN